MNTTAQSIVQRLWNYCNLLRDDGMSYGDYVEQLTYLLFLKMAHERTLPPYNQPSPIPTGYDWPSLLSRDGDQLEAHYRHTLEKLGKEPGMLGLIFRKAQNKIQDPAKLRRLIVDLIDREIWTTLDTDVKGDAYEGLLEKNAGIPKAVLVNTLPHAHLFGRWLMSCARNRISVIVTRPVERAASCWLLTSSLHSTIPWIGIRKNI